MIKRVCAFCLAFMGYKPDGLANVWERAMKETHGMCKKCMRRELGEDTWDDWQDQNGGEG